MSDLLNILRRELASIATDAVKLDAESAKLQARLRLALDKADKIKAVISLYAADDVPTVQPQLPTSVESPPEISLADAKPGVASKAAQIKAEVTHLLEARGIEHRQKILDHLISKNLMGQEKSPMASLAAYLSDFKTVFAPDGKGNFSLRREGAREPPPAPVNGAGSAEEVGSPPPSSLGDVEMRGEVP